MQRKISQSRSLVLTLSMAIACLVNAQYSSVADDFEGAGTISEWVGDDCQLDVNFANPYVDADNPSATVLRYADTGGLYGNVRFTNDVNYNMSTGTSFSMKIYVPSASITGNSPNQLSVKLQNGYMGAPWETQTEIIQPVALDQWQWMTFDFSSGNHINFNQASPAPDQRVDLNRLLFQFNGENNTDQVVAYIDFFAYDGVIGYDPELSESIYDELAWSDEFDGEGAINPDAWHHQTQLPNSWGWFNEELQHYTDREDNSYQADGLLHLVAKREDYTDQGLQRDFTSARLNSKYAFTYGRVEVRAKLPLGGGTWPAIWTLGKNVAENGGYWYPEFGMAGWPECGEIDLVEHYGWNQHYVSSALHTPSSFGATENYGGLHAADVSNVFHVYGMEWTEEEIRFTVDGQVHYTYHPAVQNMSTWPYIADQYLILNIAMQNGTDLAFQESEMAVDYVRIYQEEPSSVEDAAAYVHDFITVSQSGPQLSISNSSQAAAQLDIYDLQGRLLQSNIAIIPGSQTIDLSYATQMLLLRFEVDGDVWTERVVVR